MTSNIALSIINQMAKKTMGAGMGNGDSKWIPNPDYIPQKANSAEKTWGEILEKYDIDGIRFKDGEPDFSEISKGDVEIEPFSDSRSDNFDKADIELAKQKAVLQKMLQNGGRRMDILGMSVKI